MPMSKPPKSMKFHPAADMLPLRQEDIERLAESIREHGQLVPIKRLPDGLIIDGRNRFLACQTAGVEPVFEEVNPDDPAAYSLSMNGDRRDLTKVERACWAALEWDRKIKDGTIEKNKGGRGKKTNGENSGSFYPFATTYKVTEHYAKKALAILNHWNADTVREVMTTGDLEGTYQQMREEKAKRQEREREDEMLDRHMDLREMVGNGALKHEDAIAAVKEREREQRDKEEAQERAEQAANDQFRNILHYGTVEPFDWRPDPSRIGADKKKILADIDHVIGNLKKIKTNIQTK